MEFTFSQQGDAIVCKLVGRLIGESDGVAITEQFASLINEGHKNFVINLEELSHINSSGLGVLITLLTKVRKVEGEVFLSKPSEFISSLLLITKLNSIFKIFESDEAALAAL